MAKTFKHFDLERASYEMPQQTIVTKAGGLWLAIYDQNTCVWQDSKETFETFFIRASNELRKVHARKV